MQVEPPEPRLAGRGLRIDFKVSRLRGKLRAGRGRAEYAHMTDHALEVVVNMPVNQRTCTRVSVEHVEKLATVGEVDRVHPFRARTQRIMMNTEKYILIHGVGCGELSLETPKALGINRALLCPQHLRVEQYNVPLAQP